MSPRNYWELAAFAAVLVADAFGYVPLTLTVGLLPVVWIILRQAGEPWSSVGLKMPTNLPRALVIGSVAGVAIELLAVFGTTPWISKLFGNDEIDLELKLLDLEHRRLTLVDTLFDRGIDLGLDLAKE